MNVKIIKADVVEALRGLPEKSVNCVVTSPPYWGLRDYKIPPSVWGGDPECKHEWIRSTHYNGGGQPRDKQRWQHTGRGPSGHPKIATGFCSVCSAWLGCFGLEPTPALYVEHAMTIFREVWRVLRDDGTIWVNLGSSYWSDPGKGGSGTFNGRNGYGETYARGKRASQSLSPSHDPACGNDGRALQDSAYSDFSYSDLCDGCSVALSQRNARNDRPIEQSASLALLKDHDSEHSDCGPLLDPSPLVASLVSMQQQSSRLLRGECSHCANCDACLSILRSSSRDASLCARRGESSCDRVSRARLLIRRIADKEPSGLASVYSTIAAQAFKNKDLVDIPQMVATALRLDGWYLRRDIIWSKPNPMPESVRDRPTTAHEYIFLLSKKEKYYFDQEAVRQPHAEVSLSRALRARYGGKYVDVPDHYKGSLPGRNGGPGQSRRSSNPREHGVIKAGNGYGGENPDIICSPGGRNIRSVWEIATQPYVEAHFATFPEDLVKPCIKAGCPIGGVVLDPFAGSGTTAKVALELGRGALLIELNPDYCKLIETRLRGVTYGLPLEAKSAGLT